MNVRKAVGVVVVVVVVVILRRKIDHVSAKITCRGGPGTEHTTGGAKPPIW